MAMEYGFSCEHGVFTIGFLTTYRIRPLHFPKSFSTLINAMKVFYLPLQGSMGNRRRSVSLAQDKVTRIERRERRVVRLWGIFAVRYLAL